MVYDPDKHNRRSIRLEGYDYRQSGAYFVTLCVKDQRQHLFGEVVGGEMQLSPVGAIARAFWLQIPAHVSCAVLDAFVIMPNHMHGIIGLVDKPHHTRRDVQLNVPTLNVPTLNVPTTTYFASISPKEDSLSVIIRTYKAAVTHWCRQNGYLSFAWQSRFYEHIIRNDKALDRIRRYITENPLRWHLDKHHPA